MKFLLVHFGHDGSQVVSDDGGIEAAVELVEVVVVEGEGLVVDDDLVDRSDRALADWDIGNRSR